MENQKSIEYFKGLVNKSIKKYVVMTIIGCVFATIGLVIMLIGMTGYDPQTQSFPKGNDAYAALVIIGLIILAGPGLALTGVGVPCWIAMGVQIKVARNKLGISNNRKDKKVEAKAVEHKIETSKKPVKKASKKK